MKSTKRVYQIDLFRFIAALWVVLFHYAFRGNAADDFSEVSFPIIGEYFKYGYLGVDLFFIISGFVIIFSVENKTLLHFVKSRLVRLYPTYWFCLLFSFVIIFYFGAPKFVVTIKQLAVNTTMVQELFKVAGVDGVYWSLFVELKFYFLIALYLILKKFMKVKLTHLILFWLLITISITALHAFGPVSFPGHSLFVFLFLTANSAFFIAGMIFYQIYKQGVTLFSIIGLILCFILGLYYKIDQAMILESQFINHFSSYWIAFFLLLFFFFMFLTCTNNLKIVNSPKLIKIGALTYPLYLIHQVVGYIILNALAESLNKYVLLTLLTILMIGLSYAISRFFEIPVTKAFKSFLDKLLRPLERYV